MNYLTTTGRLTKDAVLRFGTNEAATPVIGFTVATDVGYGDRKHAVFVDCSLWGKRAQSLEPYLKKGTSVTVSGEADLREWESDGRHGANITCKLNDVVLQGGKPQSNSAAEPTQNGHDRTQPGSTPAKPADDFDQDSIPF